MNLPVLEQQASPYKWTSQTPRRGCSEEDGSLAGVETLHLRPCLKICPLTTCSVSSVLHCRKKWKFWKPTLEHLKTSLKWQPWGRYREASIRVKCMDWPPVRTKNPGHCREVTVSEGSMHFSVMIEWLGHYRDLTMYDAILTSAIIYPSTASLPSSDYLRNSLVVN